MKATYRLSTPVCLLAAALVFGTACGDDDTAEFRVVHSSPDAPVVDIYVQGESSPLFESVEYGETTGYDNVDIGSVVLEVRPAGAEATSAPVLVTQPVDAVVDGRVTVVLAGLAGEAGGDRLRALTFFEDFAARQDQRARFRVVHALPGVGAVDIDIGDDGTFEIEGLEPYTATSIEGFDLPSDQRLQVVFYTSGEPRERVTAFTSNQFGSAAEGYLIATGLINLLPRQLRGFRMLEVDEDGTIELVAQNPTAFLMHAASNVPPVDVAVNGELVAGPLDFGQLSAPLQVPPGNYAVDITLADTSDPPALSVNTPDLEAGERYLAVVGGKAEPGADEAPLQLIVARDEFDPDATTGQIQFIMAAPDAPMVDIGTATAQGMDQPVQAVEVQFGEVSSIVALPDMAVVSIGVAPSGSLTPLATFTLEVTRNLRAFGVVAGELEPTVVTERPLRLFVIDTEIFPWELTAETRPI